jgi:uncharacterized membrane protein
VNFKSWLRTNFMAGIIVLVPVLGTIALFSWLFGRVTGPGYSWLLGRFQAERVVEDVMVPAAKARWLKESDSLAAARQMILTTGLSRFPVYRGSFDTVTGLFMARHLPRNASPEELSSTRVSDVMQRYVPRVPEGKPVKELLKEFQDTGQEAAIVVSKGRTAGFVTHDDLLRKGGGHAVITEFLQKNQLLFRLVVLFLMFGLTVLIGFVARNFLGRRVFRLGETLVERIPIVNRVYVALKQISEAFWGRNKTVFTGVVLLEYPRKGLYTLGFVTSPGRGEIKAKTEEKLINVFLPTTPNPTSGWFVMVPEEQAVPLDMKVEDALKMIISGGAVVPEYRRGMKILEDQRGQQEKLQQQEEVSPSQAGA